MNQDCGDPELDRLILQHQPVAAIALVTKKSACGIPDALEIVSKRYSELRLSAPQGFVCSHEEYWKGFYS